MALAGWSGRKVARRRVSVLGAAVLLAATTLVTALPAASAPAGKPPPSSGKSAPDMVTVDKPKVPDTSHLPFPQGRPNAGPLSPAAEPSTPPAPLNDLDRAKQQAIASGKPAEVTSWRTEATTTFVNPDGSYTSTISAGPVRVATPDGGWVPVDPNLMADAAGIHPKAVPGPVTLSGGGAAPLVHAVEAPKLSSTPGKPERPAKSPRSMTVGAPANLPSPVLFGNTATYRNVVAGGDVLVETTTTGFEVSVIFNQAPKSVPVVDLPLDLGDAHISQAPNGDLWLLDSTGKQVGFAPAPEMFDATAAPPGLHPHAEKIPTSVKTVNGRQVLELRPNPAFFDDPATKYPVTVDPSATLYAAADTFVNETQPTTSHDTDQTIFSGYGALLARSRTFVSFNDALVKDPRNLVTGAQLGMYEHWASSCTPTQVNVQGATPLGSGATWNNQPTLDGHVWGFASITGDDYACPSQVGFKSIDVTGLVQQWAQNPNTTTDTLAVVAANETDPNGAKGYFSRETIGSPKLTVDYRIEPDQATNLKPSGTLVDTLTPTLKATVGGGDGGGYTVHFNVYDTDHGDTQVVNYGVNTGPGEVAYTIPTQPEGTPPILRVGAHYRWTVQTCAGWFPTICAPPATASFQVDPALAAGDRSYFTYTSRGLTDRAGVKVNVASGGLVVEDQDLRIAGVNGLDVSLARTYNSSSTQAGALGQHWTMARTTNVHLVANPDGSFTYYDEYGTADLITKNADGTYNPSGDLDASFIDAQGFGVYVLKFNHDRGSHHQGDAEYFYNNYNNADPGKEGLPAGAVEKNGNSIAYTYGAHSACPGVTSATQLCQIVDTRSRPINYTLDSAGRIVKVTDPNSTSRSLTYHYNAAGDLDSFVDATGHTTSYTYDSAHSLTRITGPGGHVTRIGYDTSGRVASLTQEVGGNDQTTTFGYTINESPSLSTTVATDANGHATTYNYGGDDRVTRATDPSGQQAATAYDNNGNVKSITDNANTAPYQFGYAASGNNNLESAAMPTGAKATWDYANPNPNDPIGAYQPTASNDTQNHRSTASYDDDGNKTSSTNALPASTSTAYQGTGSTSCGAKDGQECSTTDANGHKTTFSYDAAGNVTGIHPPAPLGDVSIVPDALSRPYKVTDGKGQTTTYSYDDMDRVTDVTYSDGAGVHYTFDNNGNTTARTDRDGSNWTYTYDQANRMLSSSGPGESIGYHYDPVGNLTSLDQPGGTVTYHYTPVNTVDQVTDPSGTTQVAYVPGHDTWRASVTYPTGVKLSTGYDNSGRPTSIVSQDVDGATVTNFGYNYTGTGNGTNDTGLRQSVTTGSSTTTYTYDNANRLTKAVQALNGGGSSTWNYGYDNAGNRTSGGLNGTTTTYTYNAADELTSGGATYDGNGNLTAGYGFTGFAYNPANQTASITPTGRPAAAMTYGGATQNHWRQDGTVHHVTAGSIGIVADTNTNPAQQLYYTRLPDGTLLNERVQGGGTYNYLTDAQHTVAATTDNTGHVANSYRYDPYGNITILTGAAPNPWRYAGGYQDDQTGLYKYGARYYNPNLGQWTQRDPSGQDPNPYTYTAGNPTTNIDPSGLGFCIFGHNDSGGCNGGSLVPDAEKLSNTVSNIMSFARGCVQSAPAGEYLGLEAAPYVSMILGPEAGAASPAVGAIAACYAGGAYYLQFGG